MAAVRPGPASRRGLQLLAEIGAMPIEVWAIAMEWGQSAAYSHAKRLEEAGWLKRLPRIRGEGVLVYATREGSREIDSGAVPLRRGPKPYATRELEATAWTVAWLLSHGRDVLGPRRLLGQPEWAGNLTWSERRESRGRVHRPSLAGRLPDGRLMPVEIELTGQTRQRLAAVLGLHARWVQRGVRPGVLVVVPSAPISKVVTELGERAGLSLDLGTLQIETLERMRSETLAACEPALVRGWYLLRR